MIEIQRPQKKANYDQVIVQQLVRWLRDGRLVLSPEFKQPASAVPTTTAAGVNTATDIPAVGKLSVSRPKAAELLSVSIRTFDRWVASGLIHPAGVGRRKIFAITELQRFLKDTSEVINV
jgi:hypothetical protein